MVNIVPSNCNSELDNILLEKYVGIKKSSYYQDGSYEHPISEFQNGNIKKLFMTSNKVFI